MLRLKLPAHTHTHTIGTQCIEAVYSTHNSNQYNSNQYNTVCVYTTIVYTTAIKDIESVCSSQLWQWGHFSSHRGYRIVGSLEGMV